MPTSSEAERIVPAEPKPEERRRVLPATFRERTPLIVLAIVVVVAVVAAVAFLLGAPPPSSSGNSATGTGWVRACVTNPGGNGTSWILSVDQVLERERYLPANTTQCALGEAVAGPHRVEVRCNGTTLYNSTATFEAGAIVDLSKIGSPWMCP